MLQQGSEGQWEISQHKSEEVCPYLVSQQKPVNESSLVPFPNLFQVVPPHTSLNWLVVLQGWMGIIFKALFYNGRM